MITWRESPHRKVRFHQLRERNGVGARNDVARAEPVDEFYGSEDREDRCHDSSEAPPAHVWWNCGPHRNSDEATKEDIVDGEHRTGHARVYRRYQLLVGSRRDKAPSSAEE